MSLRDMPQSLAEVAAEIGAELAMLKAMGKPPSEEMQDKVLAFFITGTQVCANELAERGDPLSVHAARGIRILADMVVCMKTGRPFDITRIP